MVGSTRGFASFVENKILTLSQHTVLFIERCWFKKFFGDEMTKVLDDATKMVKFIKQRPVHSKMFKKLSEYLNKQHINLLLHTEIRWLSRGRALIRVSELKGEMQDYFQVNRGPEFIYTKSRAYLYNNVYAGVP
jgi:hypothetical protein